jgi:hypothetical protein
MPIPTPTNPNERNSQVPPHSQGGSDVPAKDLPGVHADDETVKNPKTPESSGATRADRAANKAAHKAARDEQGYDREKTTITH